MLHKCANPDCSMQFKYFREGKLFEFAISKKGRECLDGSASQKNARREMFWLCGECAQRMSLECSEEGTVALIPREGNVSAA